MIRTHTARRERESRAGDGAVQVVVGVAVAALGFAQIGRPDVDPSEVEGVEGRTPFVREGGVGILWRAA